MLSCFPRLSWCYWTPCMIKDILAPRLRHEGHCRREGRENIGARGQGDKLRSTIFGASHSHHNREVIAILVIFTGLAQDWTAAHCKWGRGC